MASFRERKKLSEDLNQTPKVILSSSNLTFSSIKGNLKGLQSNHKKFDSQVVKPVISPRRKINFKFSTKYFLIVITILLVSGVAFSMKNYLFSFVPTSATAVDNAKSVFYEIKIFKGLGMTDPTKLESKNFSNTEKKFISVKALTESNAELYLRIYKQNPEKLIQEIPLANMKKDQSRTINLSAPLETGAYKVIVARGEEVANTLEFTIN